MESEEVGIGLGSKLRKVCLIQYVSGYHYIFLLDLENHRAQDADADADFLEIRPNFKISRGRRNLRFHMHNGTLYVFIYRVDCIPQVYSYMLSSKSDCEDVRLEKSMMEKVCDCWAPKVLAQFVPYRGCALLFSTKIWFISDDDDDGDDDDGGEVIDFELFDAEKGESRKLPQLRVCCLEPSSCSFKLYDSEEVFFGIVKDPMSFCIDSYVVRLGEDRDDLIIMTDLGIIFSLRLDESESASASAGWTKMDETQYNFRNPANIATSNGLCFNAYGANDFNRKWGGDGSTGNLIAGDSQFGNGRYVHFPVSSIDDRLIHGCCHSSFPINVLEDDQVYTPCILQTAFEESGGGYRRLHWNLDVLKIDLDKFPADDEWDPMGEYPKFVQRLRSFKYCLKDEELLMTFVSGMFPY